MLGLEVGITPTPQQTRKLMENHQFTGLDWFEFVQTEEPRFSGLLLTISIPLHHLLPTAPAASLL